VGFWAAIPRIIGELTSGDFMSWAIGMVGRDDLGREFVPMLAQRLQGTHESQLEGALERVEAFGPSVVTLLPRLIELLGTPGLQEAAVQDAQGAPEWAPALAAVPERSSVAIRRAERKEGAIGPGFIDGARE
jgi:hypothetical protein